MKVVTKYIAEDGTVFDSRRACEDYESKKADALVQDIIMWNDNGDRTNVLASCAVVYLRSDREVGIFYDACTLRGDTTEGLISYDEPTFYFYEGENNIWIVLPDWLISEHMRKEL